VPVVNALLDFATHVVVEVGYAVCFASVLAHTIHDFVIIAAAGLPVTLLETCVGASECSFTTSTMLIRIVRHRYLLSTRHAIATLAQIIVANVFRLTGFGLLTTPAGRRVVGCDVGHGDVGFACT
jgi:hypothetical protein